MTLLRKKVFVSGNVFFAFIDRAHPHHSEASAYFRFFAQAQYHLYTDNGSMGEAYQMIFQNISPSLARDFLRIIFLSNVNILYCDESDLKAAIKMLSTYQSNELTLQQALASVLAYRKGISQICTFEYFHPLYGLEAFYLPI